MHTSVENSSEIIKNVLSVDVTVSSEHLEGVPEICNIRDIKQDVSEEFLRNYEKSMVRDYELKVIENEIYTTEQVNHY